MSGINTSIDYTALFGGNSSSGTGALLDTIFGYTTSTTSPAASLVALQNAEANETKDVAQEETLPAVARNIADFTKAVNSATSVSQLLSNTTVLTVLLTGYGLSDQVGYTALAKKALMSNPDDSTSLANTLSNSSWSTLASTYNFYADGLKNIQSSTAIATIVNAYAETLWRESLDASTPGLANALTFRSEASSLTNVDDILGNSAARAVVTTVLDLPETMAYQTLDAQQTDITSKFDISKLQDPSYVDELTKQYLILTATSASSSSSATNPLSVIQTLTA